MILLVSFQNINENKNVPKIIKDHTIPEYQTCAFRLDMKTKVVRNVPRIFTNRTISYQALPNMILQPNIHLGIRFLITCGGCNVSTTFTYQFSLLKFHHNNDVSSLSRPNKYLIYKFDLIGKINACKKTFITKIDIKHTWWQTLSDLSSIQIDILSFSPTTAG